jgi:hypothetical protein
MSVVAVASPLGALAKVAWKIDDLSLALDFLPLPFRYLGHTAVTLLKEAGIPQAIHGVNRP